METSCGDIFLGGQLAIRAAAANGDAATVSLLLSDERVDPAAYRNFPLRVACARGHVAVAQLLLKLPSVDPAALEGQPLQLAVSYVQLEIVRLLLTDPRVLAGGSSFKAALQGAARSGSAEIVAELLAHRTYTDGAADALVLACERGHEAVAEVLLRDGRGCSGDGLSQATTTAAKSGNVALLERLLAHPLVNVVANATGVLEGAALAGNASIMRRLLSDGRIASLPAFPEDCACLDRAIEGGQLGVLELLLADSRFNSPARIRLALEKAAELGELSMVDRLLSFSVLPADVDAALVRAAGRGHTDIVDRLLCDDRAVVAISGSSALLQAAKSGFCEVIARLLQDSRIDPTADDCAALRAAAKSRQADAVNVMLSDPRMKVAGGVRAVLHALTRMAGLAHTPNLLRIAYDGRGIGITQGYSVLSQATSLGEASASGQLDAVSDMLRRVTDAALLTAECSPDDLRMAAELAAGSGELELVRRLLADPRHGLSPTIQTDLFKAMYAAAGEGHADILDLLLRADPCCYIGDLESTLWLASARGSADAVALLLADGRASPASRDCAPVYSAAAKGHAHVLQLLLHDPRVDRADAGRRIVAAIRNGFEPGIGRAAPHYTVLESLPLLRACVAGTYPAGRRFPGFMCSAVRASLPAYLSAAWARRKAVVMARQQARDDDC